MTRASKPCSHPGCPNLQPCAEHRPAGWSDARRTTLPPDWRSRRAKVMKRDAGVCQLRFPRCTVRATEVHHTGDRNDHRIEALIAVCERCHHKVTLEQAAAARRGGVGGRGA